MSTTTPTPLPRAKKTQKVKRALKSAVRLRLPARVSEGRGSGRNKLSPIAGEHPFVVLRVQVIGCQDLLSKDKNGTSDPFVVVSFANNRFQTPVIKKTLNPSYPAKDATFDFPIYHSLADRLGVLELVVWDKDMLRKDYLGEAPFTLDDLKKSGVAFDDPKNEPRTITLESTRASIPPTGTITIKAGLVIPPTADHALSIDEAYADLVNRTRHARMSLVSAPPTEGIGTIRSNDAIDVYNDDGLSSDEGENDVEGGSDDEEDDRYEDNQFAMTPTSPFPTFPTAPEERPTSAAGPSIVAPVPKPASETLATQQSTLLDVPQPTPSPKPKGKFSRVFPTRRASAQSTESSNGSSSATGSSTLVVPASAGTGSGMSTPTTPTAPTTPSSKKTKFSKGWLRKKGGYNLTAENDILGIVMLEIKAASDLPKLKNMTRTGWDMDPFVVISFGKKVFRTRVVRHSRNPVWDEKLLFHVRRYEASFKIQLTVLDWDKITANDHICDTSLDVTELLKNAPKKDETTGLYKEDGSEGINDMQEFTLNLKTAKETPWEAKHTPTLTIRAKYQPYDALRQKFWRTYIKQYDADDNGMISRLELTSMLDSLGSTLSAQTIDSFFTRHEKIPNEEEITIDQAIICLEQELGRPQNEKKRLDVSGDISAPDTSSSPTPANYGIQGGVGSTAVDEEESPLQSLRLALEKIDFSGPALQPGVTEEPIQQTTEPSQQPLLSAAVKPERQPSSGSDDADESSGTSGSEESVERVINIKNCPLCHRPRMKSRAEMDIVTHLAVCASKDWARVDRIVVGNFVTASQAQRKWYMKVISKVSSGDYRLGANSANIIVQNRITGQLEEEKMQVYVRLGIRLLYKGAKSRMEGARARRLLKSLSIKQGIKYDSPESARDIPNFIEFHGLNINEILDPLDSFKTFNEFFYRKLKPDARPVEEPDNSDRLVSAADCRMMAFETVSEATRLWIKGREFTVARLLGDTYKDQVDKYVGGALAIFRLAPQDYHRFHSPVDGTVGPMTDISGEYYTVNPQAIRTTLDVYGENVRKIVPIDSPQFGRVMAVCVGAMMVGSIKTTVSEGEQVKRGQEFGYFAFGGSTIVVLFEKGVVEWDEDLLINGRASLETLVRVGMGVGRRSTGLGKPSRKPTGNTISLPSTSSSLSTTSKKLSPAASPRVPSPGPTV